MFLGWVALSHMPNGIEEDNAARKNCFTEWGKKPQNGSSNNTQLHSCLRLFGHLDGFVKPRRPQACFDLQSRSCLMGGGEKPKGTLISVQPQHTPEDTICGAFNVFAFLSAYCIGQPRSCWDVGQRSTPRLNLAMDWMGNHTPDELLLRQIDHQMSKVSVLSKESPLFPLPAGLFSTTWIILSNKLLCCFFPFSPN